MYTTIKSFINEYRIESEGTSKLLEKISDNCLDRELAPGFRTMGNLAWHLATSGGLLKPTGLNFEVSSFTSEPPVSISAIAASYRASADSILAAVQAQWNDEKLQEEIPMFGQIWTIGSTLSALVRHEIHHRGQLTVLMRQAGLPIVGLYGPTKEEMPVQS